MDIFHDRRFTSAFAVHAVPSQSGVVKFTLEGQWTRWQRSFDFSQRVCGLALRALSSDVECDIVAHLTRNSFPIRWGNG